MKALKFSLSLALFIMFSFSLFLGQTASLQPEPADQLPQFNKTNKSILENGNSIIAAAKVHSTTPARLWQESENIPLEQLTKSPVSSIGKLCKVSGVVQQIEELSPDDIDVPGTWSAILIQSPNKNSPFGLTNVEILFEGNTKLINPGSKITLAGYYVGTHEGQNLLGGTVESVVFVTNSIKVIAFSGRR
jgi:hypothetical protein